MEAPDWLIERVREVVYDAGCGLRTALTFAEAEIAVAEVFSHLEAVTVDRDGWWWGADGLPINNQDGPLYRFTEEET